MMHLCERGRAHDPFHSFRNEHPEGLCPTPSNKIFLATNNYKAIFVLALGFPSSSSSIFVYALTTNGKDTDTEVEKENDALQKNNDGDDVRKAD